MKFNRHSDIVGQHAFLSASKYHWLNYTPQKMEEVFRNTQAIQRGTELHEFAKDAIRLGIRLPKSKNTLNLYVNDAIGFRMTPEQPLFYSRNAFGTADAIAFRNDFLRIHDLKTGVSPTSMHQLEIYGSLFCLEYDVDPSKIGMEFRIYQTDEVTVHTPKANDIYIIMDKIVQFDDQIEKLRQEA